MSYIDYGPLFNPPKEPPVYVLNAMKFAAWALPSGSSVLLVISVLLKKFQVSWIHVDTDDVALFVAISSLIGIILGRWVERFKDAKAASAATIAAIAFNKAQDIERAMPGDW